MKEIRFYHLFNQSLDQALPALLSKAYEAGHKILVRCESEAQAGALNDHLWSYNPNSFLPHGIEKDGPAKWQPIFLTAGNDNLNGATMLVLTGQNHNGEFEKFDLTCTMFDGHNESAVQAARALWKEYKEKDDFKLTYWQQNERGGWDKKSES